MQSDDAKATSRGVSRRSATLAGALAAGRFAFGLPTVVHATTRNETGDRSGTGESETGDELRARIYADDFYREARFQVVSDDLDYEPAVSLQEGEAFIEELYWNGYETRIIEYGNTRERVLFFPAEAAGVERGRPYRTGRIRSTEELAEGIVGVRFEPVGDGVGRR